MASTAYEAYISANRAAAHLITADALITHNKGAALYWQDAAICELKTLAKILGYELIKPTPKREAA